MNRWLLIALFAAGVWIAWDRSGGPNETVLPDGGLAYPGYEIAPLEDFSIEARVLSRRDYRHDREAELAPTDLALGWGPMADDAVLREIEISQGNRWYYWRAAELPIPQREISGHSANVHVIAGTRAAADALASIDADDRVRLEGKLVEVRAQDGWRWRSSLSRTDTGAGSCELLWLERIEVL
jgi:hypothetical protein